MIFFKTLNIVSLVAIVTVFIILFFLYSSWQSDRRELKSLQVEVTGLTLALDELQKAQAAAEVARNELDQKFITLDGEERKIVTRIIKQTLPSDSNAVAPTIRRALVEVQNRRASKIEEK